MKMRSEPENVKFWSEGVSCAAHLYLPDSISGQVPGVVMGHGFSMTKEGLVGEAEYLRKAGYVVLVIDYRTFGESEGEPRGQLDPRAQVLDWRNAITYLSRRPEVDAERIGLWGVSFAGGLVIQVAAFDRRPKAIVSQSPVVNGRRWMRELRSGDDWHDLWLDFQKDFDDRYEGKTEPVTIPAAGPGRAGIPIDKRTYQGKLNPDNPNACAYPQEFQKNWRPEITLRSIEQVIDFVPEHVIDMVAPRPLLIIANGGRDEVHPLDHIQDAFKKAGEPKRLAILPYPTLELYQEPGKGEAMRLAIDLFDEHLKTGQRQAARASDPVMS